LGGDGELVTERRLTPTSTPERTKKAGAVKAIKKNGKEFKDLGQEILGGKIASLGL